MGTRPERSRFVEEFESAAVAAMQSEREAEIEASPRDLFGLPVVLPRRQPNGKIEPGDRPPKQVRRHTLVSVKYLLEKFGNPIEGLLRMASYDVDDLAVFLQISRHDAWIEKRLLLAMAAPYLCSKMPQGHVFAPVAGLTVTGFNFDDTAPGEAGADGVVAPGAASGEVGSMDPRLIDRLENELTIDGTAETTEQRISKEEIGGENRIALDFSRVFDLANSGGMERAGTDTDETIKPEHREAPQSALKVEGAGEIEDKTPQ